MFKLDPTTNYFERLSLLVYFRMLQPGDGEKNIHNIVMTFTPQLSGTVNVGNQDVGNPNKSVRISDIIH